MKKVVLVISASWCSVCGPYKQALTRAGIEFKEYDADDPTRQEFITQSGVRSLPTTMIFDEMDLWAGTVVGNNVKKVQEILGAC